MKKRAEDRHTYSFAIRMTQDTREKMEDLAHKEDVPLSTILRWAIMDYIERNANGSTPT